MGGPNKAAHLTLPRCRVSPLQKPRGLLVPEFTRDIGRRLASVVLEVEGRASLGQRFDRGVDVVDTSRRIVPRRPHQRREAVGVATIDVDASLEELNDDAGIAMARG